MPCCCGVRVGKPAHSVRVLRVFREAGPADALLRGGGANVQGEDAGPRPEPLALDFQFRGGGSLQPDDRLRG